MLKELWQKIKTDYRYRNRWSLALSVIFNLVFIVSQFFDSILTGTFWASAIGIYYTAIILAKILLLNGLGQKKSPEKERKLVRATGVVLLALYVLLGGSTVRLVQDNPELAHSQVVAVIVVLYALYRVGSAIVGAFQYRKKDDLTMRAVKIVNLMAAIVAIVMVQTTITMLATDELAIIGWVTGVVGSFSSIGIMAASIALMRMK